MKITLTNDFHNTEVALNVKNNLISAGQIRRANKELCGIDGCTCSDDLGTRGPQDVDFEVCQDQNGKLYARIA